MPDEVLTDKISALLRVAEKTVYVVAGGGKTPPSKIRAQWLSKRTEFDQRIDAQLGRSESGGGSDHDR